MPKLPIGLVIFIVLGGGIFLGMPWLTEAKLMWDCPPPDPSETCLTRMRAMGHVWSRKGDMEKARFWYTQPAERSDPAAMFHLAWTYDQAVPDDFDTRYNRKIERREAAARGAPQPGIPPDEKANVEMAKRWYKKSADRGFAPAMNNLGEIYRYGLGGRPDQPKGFDLLLKAARTGNPVARLNVAISYLGGMGVERDGAEAAKWQTWTRTAKIMPDLDEPTFSRTKLYGGNLPEWERDNMLASAEYLAPTAENPRPTRAQPEALTMKEMNEKWGNRQPTPFDRPLKPDPRLPTFRETVKEELSDQSTSWNQRRKKAD